MNAALIMTRTEITRVLRNKRYMVFTLMLPVLMYLVIGVHKDHLDNTDTTVNVYYMISMATLGAFSGALMGNAIRISTEKKSGWIRQLRLTALPSWAYVTAKMVSSLATTIPSVVIVFILGRTVGGVRLDAGWKWGALALVIWIGASIFSALSVAIGYRFTPDSVQPVTMVIYLPMVILGGIYFAPPKGFMHNVATALPTYRVTEISNSLIADGTVPSVALAVIAAWLLGFVLLAVFSVTMANKQDS
jgi:ABC-2 type transport system permease protein